MGLIRATGDMEDVDVDDILFYNGTLVPITGPARPGVLAVKGGRISWIGSSGERRQARETVDLRGGALLPGFIDTHVHLTSTGFDMAGPDLRNVRSVAQALDRIAEAAQRLKPDEPLWCGGYDPSVIAERRLPTRDELDRAVPDRVAWVSHAEYHAGSGNSPCLDYLGITGDHSSLPGIDRELRTGRPTGLLLAEANGWARRRVSDLIPDPARLSAQQAAAREAARRGVTTVHAMEGGNLFHDRDVHTLLKAGDTLAVDVVLYWQTTDLKRVISEGLPRIGGCVPLDGSTGTHTGAMHAPYTDAPDCVGVTYLSQEELDEWVLGAHRAGLQVSMHVGGDRSITMLLDAFEKALKAYPRADHRHRIEHFEVPQLGDFDRAAGLGVALAMQPAFDYFWGAWEGDYRITLGDERWARTNALRTAIRRGVVVAGGSDSGVTPIDPLLGVHAAVNHHRPDQCLTTAEALRLFTINAAGIGFQEDDCGALEPGRRADLVVLDQNPLEVPAPHLKDVGVRATFRSGRPTWMG